MKKIDHLSSASSFLLYPFRLLVIDETTSDRRPVIHFRTRRHLPVCLSPLIHGKLITIFNTLGQAVDSDELDKAIAEQDKESQLFHVVF